ncbi:MAG TPA: ABC transporter ATP-binding protein [Aggregatilinea sp.]|uniref:ABC transporter ATP-binding protein n=1 Tax=Aggregatilinea sp. TaxID=2806333 RepID=UPI002C7EF4DF|nr:ABC transporter ATP-binding protein [Aggregatilinea sp.]HML22678.1 ABC transporter ATP-binding protein [Aggregatilinea sp.]
MSAIEVSKLRKIYHGVTAVNDISFEVRDGEVFGLLGPNGAGKTTTVECIEGLRQPDGGTITVLGHTLNNGSMNGLKEQIGIQLQTTGLYPLHTVHELLTLFGSFYKHPVPPDDLIKMVSLEDKRDTRSKNLSGGQMQRLSLALALVNDPRLVFLDEPTTGLDPQSRRQIWNIVSDLKSQGKTVMMTTHYMEEAQALCDRVAVMDSGTIIALNSPQGLIAEHFETTAIEFEAQGDVSIETLKGLRGVEDAGRDGALVTLYTRDTPRTIEGLLDVAREGAFQFSDLRVRSATLEDVFLKLTGRRIRD